MDTKRSKRLDTTIRRVSYAAATGRWKWQWGCVVVGSVIRTVHYYTDFTAYLINVVLVNHAHSTTCLSSTLTKLRVVLDVSLHPILVSVANCLYRFLISSIASSLLYSLFCIPAACLLHIPIPSSSNTPNSCILAPSQRPLLLSTPFCLYSLCSRTYRPCTCLASSSPFRPTH